MRSKSSMKFLKRMLSIVVLCCIITQLFSLTAFATTELKGDVNGDGKVSVSDARMVLNHLAKLEEISEDGLYFADFDGDTTITFNDARNILLASIDLPPEYLELQKITQLTPKKSNNGITTQSKFCMVVNDYAETLAATPVDNKSNPLYTPLLAGTFDYVKEGPVKDSASGHKFYVLNSGRRVYTDAVKVFTGYDMPLNNIEVMDQVETFNGSTNFYLKLDWRVPFNVTIKPQSYTKGYNSRVHNLKDGKFTGTYMDITFYYTTSPSGEISFPDSEMIKGMKWIEDTSKNTVTLRIYFKTAGSFMGYNVYYDEKNYLVVSVKEPSYNLNDRVIMIDPGHGGEQPGAGSGTGVYERDVTYKIALELKTLFEKQGATVLFSRDDSKSVPEIEERRLNTYALNPDMFISIHCDASDSKSMKGSSVYYYKNYSGPLAFSISKTLPAAVKNVMGYDMSNRGAHFYPFLVTRVENCPSVLVECGFITNTDDFNIINSTKGRKAIAMGIYEGVVEYYGY